MVSEPFFWHERDARVWAAAGLATLAHHKACADQEVLDAIERLSTDPVPAVRYEIARRLHALQSSAPDRMWALLEFLSQREQDLAVLHAVVSYPLYKLCLSGSDRAVTLTHRVFERIGMNDEAEQVRIDCALIFAHHYIWRDDPSSRRALWAIAESPEDHAEEARMLIISVRDYLKYFPSPTSLDEGRIVRQHAYNFLNALLSATQKRVHTFEVAHGMVPFAEWPESSQEVTSRLVRICKALSVAFMSISGALDKATPLGKRKPELSLPQRERLYQEASSTFDLLATDGNPSMAYDLVETLAMFVPCDPEGIFLRIGQVVRLAVHKGYHLEFMAADQVVAIVKMYLAEHLPLFRQSNACRETLIELLDTFVKAGWPSAGELIYHLEDIYR